MIRLTGTTWSTKRAPERHARKHTRDYLVDLSHVVPAPVVVRDKKTAGDVLAWLEVAQYAAVDSEFGKSGLLTWQVSDGEHRALIVHKEATKYFLKWLSDPHAKKIFHHAYADLPQFAGEKIEVKGLYADTMVLDWLIDENRLRHGLKYCVREWLGLRMRDWADVFGYVPDGKKKAIVREPEEAWAEQYDDFIEYATLDAYGTYWLFMHHKAILERLPAVPADKRKKYAKGQYKPGSLWQYYRKYDVEFTQTLVNMSARGIAVSVPALKDIGEKLYWDMMKASHVFTIYAPEIAVEGVKGGQKYIRVIKPEDINLRSPQQLATLFYDKMHCRPWEKIEAERLGKTRKRRRAYAILAALAGDEDEEETAAPGSRSTNAKCLAAWAEDGNVLARLLLDYRRAATQKGTFIGEEGGKGLLAHIEKDVYGVDVLKSDFNQIGTTTGRLASRAPNLQNIPARKDKDPYRIRRAFVARPGSKLIVADYSMIELRVMAHLSRDSEMLHALRNGVDLHSKTAIACFNLKCALEEVKDKYPDKRNHAKAINFGLQYGMRARLLALSIGCTIDEAQKYIDAYFNLYNGVWRWMKGTIEHCRHTGQVTTLLGRIRRIPEINLSGEENYGKIAHAENQAMNTPIQGGVADIIKKAMNEIENDTEIREHEAQLLLQVHDELIVEAPNLYADWVADRVKSIMENAYTLIVPTPVSVETGDNWDDAKG